MSRIARRIVLADVDLLFLKQLVRSGKESARKLTPARALQVRHQGQHAQHISDSLGIRVATLFNRKKRYRPEGLPRAIAERARPGQFRKVTQQVKAQIT